MTVIAVKRNKTNIEISCDSQTSYGYDFKTKKMKDESSKNDFGKIFRVNGMVIGSSGAVEESNLLKMFCKNHKPKGSDSDNILEFMSEFREWIGKRTGKANYELGNSIIIVINKKIFEVCGFYIQKRKDFWAAGSGMFLAIAALHLGKSTKEAVDIAKEYDMYCGGKTETLTIKL